MFEQITPVNEVRHRAKKVKALENFAFAKDLHMVGLMVQEFPIAAASYPIVFLERPESDDFLAVALVGFKAGENLFVDADGKWTGAYVPAMLRRYPFILARTEEEGRFTVCVDEASGLIDDEAGQSLFTDEGAPTEALERVKRYLVDLQQLEGTTKAFCAKLKENNLLAPLNLRIRDAGELRNVTGCWVVNEERLGSLSEQMFLDLRRSHYLQAIYSHIISLGQIDRLIQEKDRRQAADAGSPSARKKGAKA